MKKIKQTLEDIDFNKCIDKTNENLKDKEIIDKLKTSIKFRKDLINMICKYKSHCNFRDIVDTIINMKVNLDNRLTEKTLARAVKVVFDMYVVVYKLWETNE